MINAQHMAFLRSNGILIARILMGGMFILAGLDKVMNPSGTASFIASAGLPENDVLALLVGALEIVLGAAIVVSKKITEAALLLAVFVILVSFLLHGPGSWADAPMQKVMFSKNAAILAGLLYIAAYGGGNGWKLERAEA